MPPVPVLLEIGPMDLLRETYRIWAMHREFRTVLAELNGYSDRELTELGIGRGDVVRVAFEEAERRIVTPNSTRRAPEAPGDWHGPVPAIVK
jgi:uncharacterized protein YjiS (DUF1127 family)